MEDDVPFMVERWGRLSPVRPGIIGYRDLGMLKAVLDEPETATQESASILDRERLAAQDAKESRPEPYAKNET